MLKRIGMFQVIVCALMWTANAEASSVTFDFSGSNRFLGLSTTFTSGGQTLHTSAARGLINRTGGGLGVTRILTNPFNHELNAAFFGSERLIFRIPEGYAVSNYQLSGLDAGERATTHDSGNLFSIANLVRNTAFRVRSLTIRFWNKLPSFLASRFPLIVSERF